MFEKMTKKMAEKMGRSVKTTIEPVKQTVDTKVDLYSRILKLGVLILLFIEGTKKVNNIINSEANSSPNQIVINNYLNGKDGED